MNNSYSQAMIKRLAGLELNELLFAKILPSKIYNGTRVTSSGTPIYDINGEVLFHRVPISKGKKIIAFADIATNPNFGAPLLAVNPGLAWDEKDLLSQATAVVEENRQKFDNVRFVAYSYPKIAVQFLRDKQEVLMLEIYTWQKVPEIRKQKDETPLYFERWSFIEELEPSLKKTNISRFEEKNRKWDEICPPDDPPKGFNPEILQVVEFGHLVSDIAVVQLVDTRELHFNQEDTSHSPCYELRGQLTGVWCVAASVQMLLDFYRYNYAQTRLAQELNLGTLADPNGLPYVDDGDVVTVVEDLSSNALDANMNTAPTWAEFVNEIRANRPLISFIPRHARTVAGYTIGPSVFGGNFRGLLVYDPWPPSTTGLSTDGGAITRWENYETHTYRVTFTAQLTLV